LREEHFSRFWESTISPGVSPDLVSHWRAHEFAAVQRGVEAGEKLLAFVSLPGRRVLDTGCCIEHL
jgi:hypothetical protein